MVNFYSDYTYIASSMSQGSVLGPNKSRIGYNKQIGMPMKNGIQPYPTKQAKKFYILIKLGPQCIQLRL